MAGKTGTTSDNHDRWFSGFTPQYTASVWCGFDDPEEIRLVVNRNPAVVMWRKVMVSLLEDQPERQFNMPDDESFVSVNVCSQTGLLCGPLCEGRSIKLFASDVPTQTCNNHQGFDIFLCYPNGEDGDSYCATDYCVRYRDLLASSEVKALIAGGATELAEFVNNQLVSTTITVLTNGKNDASATLEDALAENHMSKCPVHTAELLRDLEAAIQRAREAQAPPEPEPEPDDGDDGGILNWFG